MGMVRQLLALLLAQRHLGDQLLEVKDGVFHEVVRLRVKPRGSVVVQSFPNVWKCARPHLCPNTGQSRENATA